MDDLEEALQEAEALKLEVASLRKQVDTAHQNLHDSNSQSSHSLQEVQNGYESKLKSLTESLAHFEADKLALTK